MMIRHPKKSKAPPPKKEILDVPLILKTKLFEIEHPFQADKFYLNINTNF